MQIPHFIPQTLTPTAPVRATGALPLSVDAVPNGAPDTEKEAIEALVNAMSDRPLAYFEKKVLLKAGERLGLENVRRLKDNGLHIQICDGEGAAYRACYYPSKKLLQIGYQRLDADTATHEMGHALDDALQPDENGKPVLKSERDARLEKMFNAYKARVETLSWWEKLLHRGMWSDYGTTSPQEYVADAVMDYTHSARTRARLERCDAEMFAYTRDFLTSGKPA